MAAKSGENLNFLKFCIEYFSTTLWVKNFVEIALSLTVSEILANYSKVVLKIHNEVPKWLLKFCRNRSVSDGFRDINIFCFSAKIQDGRQKWRKLKFFNCT